MKMPPLSANKIMIIIGCALVFLMVLSGGLSIKQHSRLAAKCHDGDMGVCTALINSKQVPEKERAKYFAIRAYYYDQKGDYDRAVADYGNAISRIDGQPAAQAILYANRASSHAKKGGYDDAIADYNTAIRLAPPSGAPGLYCGRAEAEYHKGDAAHGDADLAQARKMAPQAACIAKVQQPGNPAPSVPTPGAPHPTP